MARVAMIVGNPCNPDYRVVKEAEALAAEGHTVRVFCRAETGLAESEVINGVTYQRRPLEWHQPAAAVTAPGRRPGLSTRLGSRFLRFELVARAFAPAVAAWRPDLVHAHDLACLPAGARAARAARARLVYDSHELETHRNPPLPGWQRLYHAALERHYIRRADAVVTVCEPIAEHLQRAYGIARPAVVLNAPPVIGSPAAASWRSAGEPERDIRREAGVPDGGVLGVYPGLVTFNRGLETLLDALPALPGVWLAAVGPRNEDYAQGLLRRAAERGLGRRFAILPAVHPERVVSYIAGADIGLNPLNPVTLSYQYALPNKLFEMALAGLPIVNSTARASARFVTGHGLGLAFRAMDAADCARAVREVMADLPRYRPSPEKLASLRDTYGWHRQAETLQRVYARVLAGRPAAEPAGVRGLRLQPA